MLLKIKSEYDTTDVVGLIACGQKKINSLLPIPAKNLYLGLPKTMLGLSKGAGINKNFILSAKYGLVGTEELITNYNLRITDLSEKEKLSWMEKVKNQLKEKVGLDKRFFIFASADYSNLITPFLTHYVLLFKGGKGFFGAKENLYRNLKKV